MPELNEKTRTYIYLGTDEYYTVYNVTHLAVSNSGGHRLTTGDGKLVYIAPKWIAIEIESDKGWEA